MGRLEGKVVIVTGAAQGIGQAVAAVFSEHGATVVPTDVKKPAPVGSPERGAILDVSEERDWRRVVDAVEREFGRVDVLVNNAAIATPERITETDLTSWSRVIAVSQTGPFLGMRTVIPVMQRGGGGSIINLSSIWGVTAVEGLASYHAAKGAVRTLTKNAAVAYARDRIRVNSVHPGFVDTPSTRGQAPALTRAVIDATPLARAGEPREIAHGCLFLASDESSFVTGAEIPIDGGYLAR